METSESGSVSQASELELCRRRVAALEAEAISREVVSLPVYPELSDDGLVIVANSVRDFFAAHRAHVR